MTSLADIRPLGQLLSSRTREGQRLLFDVTEDWQQGRTLFGGILSVLAVQAMRDVCGSDWPMRALQTSFVAPALPGPLAIDVTLLRQGKHIRQVQAHVSQTDAQGQTTMVGVLLAVFGDARASTLPARKVSAQPLAQTFEQSTLLPFIPGLTPNFTQHLELRLAEGGFPFTGTDSWISRAFLRLKDTAEVDNELLTIVMADSGPTPALAQLTTRSPASSVSWALELRPVADADTAGHWRVDKEAVVADEGYVNDRTEVWTPDGRLAGFGYQVVAVYG